MSTSLSLNFGNSATKLGDIGVKTGLSSELGVTTGVIINTALVLVGTIFFLLTVYAGIRWMTAQGNSEHVETAKKTLIAAVIGLIITMMAYAITMFVTTRLGGGAAPTVDPCKAAGGECRLPITCINSLRGTELPEGKNACFGSLICCSK